MKLSISVGIDATSWANPRGYGRYARGLLSALLCRPRDGYRFTLFVDRQTAQRHQLPAGADLVVVDTAKMPAEAAVSDSRRSSRDLWAMSSAVAQAAPDLFYYPTVYTYFPARTRATVLLGIHDVIAEKYTQLVFPDWYRRRLWQLKGRLGRRRADHIVTVSHYAAEEIRKQFNWPADRLWVVGEAPDPCFHILSDRAEAQATLRRIGLSVGQRYLICLGGLNPHKNLGMLLDVLARLRRDPEFADVRLLLVGPTEDDGFTPGAAGIRRQVSALALADAVLLTGYLPDVELVHLLNCAQLLLLPSLEEGFGLGAVEAAACGIPVLATSNSPLPELLAGGGLFLDPERPADWQRAIAYLLQDERARQEMGAIARQRAAELTWQRAAGQFMTLLDHVCQEFV